MKSIAETLNLSDLVDTHAHISSKNYDTDRLQVIENALKNDVDLIFDVATDIDSAMLSTDIAKTSTGKVKSFVGIDPEIVMPGSHMRDEEFGSNKIKPMMEHLKAITTAKSEFVVGIGETGMDYYWLEQMFVEGQITRTQINKSQKLQEELFRAHLELAEELKLPLTIHSRGAEEECLKIAKEYKVVGIFHSYTADYAIAKKILNAGWGLGVNGIVTFTKSGELRNVYKQILGKVSSDWNITDYYNKGIFFETDCPFLTPEGKRGERNEPANVRMIFDSFNQNLNS